jgi:hypothetical protein
MVWVDERESVLAQDLIELVIGNSVDPHINISRTFSQSFGNVFDISVARLFRECFVGCVLGQIISSYVHQEVF